MSLVEVSDLTISFDGADGVRAVDGLSFTLEEGAALGVVGESGSGKSASAYALLGLHRGTGATVGGSIRVAGVDVQAADDAELRALRGAKAAMVFQDPLSSLDPYYAVGDQIAEVYRVHTRASGRAARARAVDVLDRVGIPDAVRRSRSRPHEFSGGMRQRALIAMALACEPQLLIADEPTTALDVTVQAQILDLLHTLRRETGMGLLLVTHDVGVAAESVDEVLVMQSGREVERGPVAEVLGAPRQPYTRTAGRRTEGGREAPGAGAGSGGSCRGRGRAGARRRRVPCCAGGRAAARSHRSATRIRTGRQPDHRRGRRIAHRPPRRDTRHRRRERQRQDDARPDARPPPRPDRGRLQYRGTDIGSLSDKALRPYRRELQMVFQDPVASLNPRRSIGESVADPLRAAAALDDTRIRARVQELLERVGLDPDRYDRYPHEFSGGQRQRVGIARALAADPKLIVCDEPVSALDVTTQAQVTALLAELQRELGLGLVFIAHDLAVVRQVSDRVAVMRQGRIVEQGSVDEVYGAPQDPYTKQLLAAVPALDPALAAVRRTARKELAAA